MTQPYGNAFLRQPPKSGIGTPKAQPAAKGVAHPSAPHKLTFTKIFRWRRPEDQAHEPAVVEIAGTFTNWRKVPLVHDPVRGGWSVTLAHIPGNRTHHYMLLADGKPVEDPYSDGLAIPGGAQELPFAMATHRGPRVFMLFSQTK